MREYACWVKSSVVYAVCDPRCMGLSKVHRNWKTIVVEEIKGFCVFVFWINLS